MRQNEDIDNGGRRLHGRKANYRRGGRKVAQIQIPVTNNVTHEDNNDKIKFKYHEH